MNTKGTVMNCVHRSAVVGLILASLGAWCGAVVAGDADLDTSFGDGGVVIYDGSTASMWLQADGRIVAAGSAPVTDFRQDVMVRRFDADGSPDETFGTDGLVTTDIAGRARPVGPESDLANAVAVQADGKIVVAGSTGYDIDDAIGDDDVLVARYTADGSLDETFGDGGIVTTEVTPQSADWASAMVLQPDGRILVAGAHLPDAIGVGELVGVHAEVLLVRYLPDGSLDTAFGTNGIVTTSVNAETWDAAHSVVLQPDGRIVIAGENQVNLLLARYESDGTLDETFGLNGVATTLAGSGRSVALQPDGRIVVAGITPGIDCDVLLARYDAAGRLDSTFGTEGATVTSFDESSYGNSVVVQPDDKIVVAGALGRGAVSSPPRQQLLLRYDPDGALDTTFGTEGLVVTDVRSDRGSGASAVNLQADQKLVVADYSGAVVRYGTAAGLVPMVGIPLGGIDGFQVGVTNFDPSYDWTTTTTAGRAAVDSDGLVTVTGIGPGATATVTITTSRPGYESASTEVSGASLPAELPATGGGRSIAAVAVFAVAFGAVLAQVATRRPSHTDRRRSRA